MTPKDYESWDFLIEEILTIKGLTSLQRKRARKAFQFLSGELGKGFPKRIMGERHPFAYQFVNRAPWTRIWLTWLASALRELKKQDEYGRLLKRIKNTEKLFEALTVLKVAYKFSKTGFSILFDPEVTVNGRSKIPDMVLNGIQNSKIYVEVSEMQTSEKKQEAFITGFRISEHITRAHPRVLYSGKIYKIMEDPDISRISEMAEELGNKANTENEMKLLCLEGVEIAAAPQGKDAVIEKWAKERGFEVNNLLWPAVFSNEIRRTKRKIRTEHKQLPKEYLNVIVIIKNDWFWENLLAVIGELEKEFSKHQNLLAVIILCEYLDQIETKVGVINGSVIYQKQLFDVVAEKGIVMFTDKYGVNLSDPVVARILQAFV